jgi:hypothetical protein
MKICLLILLSVFTSLKAFTQMDYYYGADLSRLGFRHNTIYTNLRDSPDFNNPFTTPGDTATGVNSNLVFEIMTKHVYFQWDVSILTDAAIGLAGGYSGIQEKYPGFEQVEASPIRLAFGLPIGTYFNVYVGGQYEYNEVQYGALTTGGNLRGAGIHTTFGSPYLFLRYSYMHDWVRREERRFKGTANTNELAVGIFPFREVRIGLMFKARARTIDMDYLFDGTDVYPAFSSKGYVYAFSIVIPGIASGTSRTVSKAVYETNKEFNGSRKGYEYNSTENYQLKKNK